MSLKKEQLINIVWNILPFIILFIFLLAFHKNIYSFDKDDSYFTNVQEKLSFPEFMIRRYTEWSGRISIEATMYLVLEHSIRLWRLINPLVLTGLCINLAILLFGNKFWLNDYRITAKTIWLICLGIGLINIQVLGSSSFWITGSFNYLWPIFAGSLALFPFREGLSNELSRSPIKTFLCNSLFFISAIYAGLGNEQVALVLCGLMFAVNVKIFVSKKKVVPFLLLMNVITILAFIILWTAPGNRIRYEQSIIQLFPNVTVVQSEAKT